MTREQRVTAMDKLSERGFQGELGVPPDFKAHDDGSEDAPWISEWLSAAPCPYPELIRS